MNTNQEVIRRLSRYRNVMRKMKGLGLVKVFSDNLADAVGVSSSLVRKDFSMFNLTGNKRGGYRIDDLVAKLNVLLGKDKKQKIVIIGCGKLGQALMNHNGHEQNLNRDKSNITKQVDKDVMGVSKDRIMHAVKNSGGNDQDHR